MKPCSRPSRNSKRRCASTIPTDETPSLPTSGYTFHALPRAAKCRDTSIADLARCLLHRVAVAHTLLRDGQPVAAQVSHGRDPRGLVEPLRESRTGKPRAPG